jgi:photosystem II stability/assembly factor-like uncharacterized protein
VRRSCGFTRAGFLATAVPRRPKVIWNRCSMTRLAIRLAITFAVAFAVADALRADDQYVIFRSTDRGRSWARSDAGLPSSARINALASAGDLTLAGTNSGVYFSADEGQSWTASVAAPKGVARILSFARLGRKVFAGTDRSGLIVSSDNGRTWSRVDGFHPQKVRTILCLNETIYAGTDQDGVFASRDRGESWIHLTRGLPNGSQIFALGSVNGKLFAGLYANGLYAWDAPEERWIKQGNVSPLALASLGETLVAGHNPGGLLWSDDSGATWTQGVAATSDKTGELSNNAPVWEMAAGDDIVIAGAGSGIFYSDDRGRTWTRARAGLPAKSPGVSFLLTKNVILAGSIIDP